VSRVAVVTGGGSGVGWSICEHLARDGHRVASLDLDDHAVEVGTEVLRDRGTSAIGAVVDVADRVAVHRAFDSVRAHFGPVEILVTSAAVSGFIPFEQVTADDWTRALAVNLSGTFHCIQAAISDMTDAGWGRIVTLSSAAGQTGSRRQAHYAASKGGVIALTKTVALEYAAKGITANTISPFTVDTPDAAGRAGCEPPAGQ
jgi:2-hydroxycyclohexanecarboxyl-CoA dehydrogenase